MRFIIRTAILASVVGLLPGYAVGGEALCDTLGANCICSEPFNTTSVQWDDDYFNFNDTTTKQCTFEGHGGGFVRGRAGGASSDATALSRLPAGHQVRAFLASANGGNGTFWIGKDNLGAQYTARVAVRFYTYQSPTFSTSGSKLFAANNTGGAGSGQFDISPGAVHFYGLDDHRYDNGSKQMGDCCVVGPPINRPGYSNVSTSLLQGKWWRWEVIVSNRAGPGIRYELYGKNVTDDTPEIHIIDTQEPCPNCGPDPAGLGATDLQPPTRIDDLLVNFYRQGTMTGWRGISHLIYAGWDTNSGQRIGSALEVEGVAGEIDGGPATPVVRPNPPTTLSVQ